MSQPAYDLSRHDLTASARDAAGSGRVELRLVHSPGEYQACVELQVDIWGAAFGDRVPASLLQVATHIGGLTIGAFAPDGSVVGFVFGLTGVKDDEIVHWSHMLGVRAAAREVGIGLRLKEYQRTALAERGIAHTYWTFDPLQAKNAHLNLNRLGVPVIEYAVDMYGTTASPLHYGLATDRLIVKSSNLSQPARDHSDIHAGSLDSLPIMTAAPQSGDPPFDPEARPAAALIEIPADLAAVVSRSPSAALEWRATTRQNFHWALSNGYTVTGLRRDPVSGRAFYRVSRLSVDQER